MKKIFLISVALVIIGTLVWVGCSRQKSPSEIRVGVVHAQTGMFAAFGQGGAFGIKAAVDDVNKQGGVSVGGTKLPIKLSLLITKATRIRRDPWPRVSWFRIRSILFVGVMNPRRCMQAFLMPQTGIEFLMSPQSGLLSLGWR